MCAMSKYERKTKRCAEMSDQILEEKKAMKREYDRKWRKEHPGYDREWKKSNRGKVNASARKSYAANPEKARAKHYRWTKANQERVRAWDHRYHREYPEKVAAQHVLQRAIEAGRVERPDTCHCGNPNPEGHHEDYSRPLMVTWLCHACHMALHAKRKSLGRKA